jgi:hypothetical protein
MESPWDAGGSSRDFDPIAERTVEMGKTIMGAVV